MAVGKLVGGGGDFAQRTVNDPVKDKQQNHRQREKNQPGYIDDVEDAVAQRQRPCDRQMQKNVAVDAVIAGDRGVDADYILAEVIVKIPDDVGGMPYVGRVKLLDDRAGIKARGVEDDLSLAVHQPGGGPQVGGDGFDAGGGGRQIQIAAAVGRRTGFGKDGGLGIQLFAVCVDQEFLRQTGRKQGDYQKTKNKEDQVTAEKFGVQAAFHDVFTSNL